MDIIWICPTCGEENVDPDDTDIFHCSECLSKFTHDELDPDYINHFCSLSAEAH